MIKEKRKIDFKYNLKTYLDFLIRYKYLALIIILFSIFLRGRFLLEKYLFKVIIDNTTNFTTGLIEYSALLKILFIIGGVYLGIIFIIPVIIWARETFLINLTTNMMQDLKRKYFNHIIGLHYEFHTTHKTGSMISRLLRGGWTIDKMNDLFVYQIAPLIIEVILVTISLLYLDWISAFIALCVSIFFVSYGLFFQRFQQSANLRAVEKEDLEKGNTSDFITNIDSIKYYGKEKAISERYEKLTTETKQAHKNHWYYFRWYGSVLVFIQTLGLLLVVYFSLLKFINNEITIGSLVFIYTAYIGLMEPMWRFNNGIRDFYKAMADFQDLFEYGKIENEVKDVKGASNLEIKQGEIEFKNINFKYGKRTIFQNFNLKIPKNNKVALVGHSGCGKTTLIKLLYRLYNINEGEILIDGKNIKKIKQNSLRENMSIVPQECLLFDDTIYNNIKFSNPKASKEEIINAIKFAQLDKIINEFPDKENTIVGERGIKLSGGEKQRVSIARAILANKKILVLDEATSSLDSETEYEIQRDLENLMKGRTSIIIAHRLSTIMKADKIVVMKKGEIVQIGKHEDLINQDGEYKILWNLQKGGYIK